MTQDDDYKGWEPTIKRFNKGGGFAGIFNYNNAHEKAAMERNTVEEWRISVAAEFALNVAEPIHNPCDPPDCYVDLGGKRLSVELVQLVEQEHKKRAIQGEDHRHGRLFMDTAWQPDRFIAKLNEIIGKKGEKYEARNLEIDILIIHTAEPWLTSGQATEWLGDSQVTAHHAIKAAFLLFEYEPGRGVDHWAVIRLCGDVVPAPADHQG